MNPFQRAGSFTVAPYVSNDRIRSETIDLTGFNLDFLPDDPRGIYLVGGAVRDLLLGKDPDDIDLAVAGDPGPVAATIAQKRGGSIIDLGKKGFGVLRVAAPSLTADITPLNDQSIEENLRRRDFTINALAVDIADARLVDCTGGLSDLEQKTIRMVSSAVFAEDPVRLVRAYRMAAMFRFCITPRTRTAIARSNHLIGTVAGERVWAEVLKLLTIPTSAPTIRQMADDGLLVALVPELKPAIGCTQNRFHQFDVFEHSLRAYERLEILLADADGRLAKRIPADEMANVVDHGAIIKYAALLHDVGKPATKTVDADGGLRFPGHAGHGATIAATISRRLRLSNRQREAAVTIIRNHVRPLFLYRAKEKDTLGDRGIIRFFNHCDTLTLPVLVHSLADCMAKHHRLQPRDADFISFCHRLMADYGNFRKRQASVPPLINGHDLIHVFGLFPAPRFKWILSRVNERRLSGELSTREEALAWVKTQIESQR